MKISLAVYIAKYIYWSQSCYYVLQWANSLCCHICFRVFCVVDYKKLEYCFVSCRQYIVNSTVI
jgi:hypothetical protein